MKRPSRFCEPGKTLRRPHITGAIFPQFRAVTGLRSPHRQMRRSARKPLKENKIIQLSRFSRFLFHLACFRVRAGAHFAVKFDLNRKMKCFFCNRIL